MDALPIKGDSIGAKSETFVQKIDTFSRKSEIIIRDTVIVHDCDSLKTRLSLANFKLERVKYYLKICQRRPSQTKFLVSWINRAIK